MNEATEPINPHDSLGVSIFTPFGRTGRQLTK